jgi:hypothetical protein
LDAGMTDYESLLNDLLTAGVKCTLSGAVKLACASFYGEEVPEPAKQVVKAWEVRTLAAAWQSDTIRQRGNG